MSASDKDKRILELAKSAYDFQNDLRERLDCKLNNFVGITGTVSTISVGVALFVFQTIKQINPFYPYLVTAFIIFFGFLISAMIIGLRAYRPSDLFIYPEDPEQSIIDYSQCLTETDVIRVVATSFAEAANENKKMNKTKSSICQWVFRLLVIGAIVFVVFAILMVASLGNTTTIIQTYVTNQTGI